MKTTFNISTNIQVEVEVSEGSVFIRVITDIDKRSYFYATISEAIKMNRKVFGQYTFVKVV